MDTPDMRWEPDNLSVVGDGTLIWLTQKALWFSKKSDKWLQAAVNCSEETMRRIHNGGHKDLMIPFDADNLILAEQAAKRIRERG